MLSPFLLSPIGLSILRDIESLSSRSIESPIGLFSALPTIFLLCWARLGSVKHFSAMLNTFQLCLTLSAELLSRRRRPLTRFSQKPLHGSRPNFVESYPSAISPDCFFFFLQNFSVSNFYDFFFFVFVNMGPYGSQNFKTLLLPQFRSDFTQTLWQIWRPWGNIGCYFFGDLPKIKTIMALWIFC